MWGTKVVRLNLIKRVISKQRIEGGEELAQQISEEIAFQEAGIAKAMVLRWEGAGMF